jgi:hypothetical protein
LFHLTQAFSVVGDVAGIGSVDVTVANSRGSSQTGHATMAK